MLVVRRCAQRVHAFLSALQQDSASSGRRLFFCLLRSCRSSISISACSSTSSTSSAASCIPIALRAPQENEKEWSLADTALLNDAYRTLRDPIRRTEYLLKLHGAEIGEEHAGKDRKTDPSRVPADLLEEAFDLNMQLEEMRMVEEDGRHGSRTAVAVSNRQRQKFDGLLDDVDRDLRAQWQVWDDGDEARRTGIAKEDGVSARSPALHQQPRPRRRQRHWELKIGCPTRF